MADSYASVAGYVQKLLNDAEPGFAGTHWPLVDLFGYAQELFTLIAEVAPGDFTLPQQMPLTPGVTQRLPNTCTKLISIRRNIRANGSAGGPIWMGQYDVVNRPVPTHGCGPCAAKKAALPYQDIAMAAIDPADTRTFAVSPPVTPGKFTRVELLCLSVPQADTPNAAFDPRLEKYRATLVEWMLYRAYGKDTESAVFTARAEGHYKHVFTVLGAIIGTVAAQQVKTKVAQ